MFKKIYIRTKLSFAIKIYKEKKETEKWQTSPTLLQQRKHVDLYLYNKREKVHNPHTGKKMMIYNLIYRVLTFYK